MIGLTISGLEELEHDAKQMADVLAAFAEKATEENLKDGKDQSVRRAPYKTGTLRRSIAYTQPTTVNGVTSGSWGADLPYARITELGGVIPAHTVEVKNRKVLTDGKGNFFGKKVTIPAQVRTARPYLFPVLVEGMQRFLWRYGKAYDEAIRSVKAR